MKVSFSAIQTYLACEARYAYKYRDGLRVIRASPHFEVGSIIHAALDTILTSHWKGDPLPSAEIAVRDGCAKLREKRRMTPDSEDHAIQAVRALEWHVPRMRLESWETITVDDAPAVELELAVPFGGVTLQAHIDWIAKSKVNGRTYIIDHKTSKNRLTDQGWAEFDLQLSLYLEATRIAGIASDGALLHQMCYHPPSDVAPLKRVAKAGRRFSSSQSTRTDWETYQNALIAHGEDPDQYLDMRDMLDDQCAKAPFRRWVPNITTPAGHEKMLGIARQAIDGMRAIKEDGAREQPTRVSEWTCGQCEMRPWCDAVLLGHDPRSLILSVYSPDEGSPYADAAPGDVQAIQAYAARTAQNDRYNTHGYTPHG